MASTDPTTCTVVTGADGTRCGAPAVAIFTGRNGEEFAECADHAPATSQPPAQLAVGDAVTVHVHGVDKAGTIAHLTPTRARVTVPTYGGRDSRVVTVARADLA
jgi:hypothetical protein